MLNFLRLGLGFILFSVLAAEAGPPVEVGPGTVTLIPATSAGKVSH